MKQAARLAACFMFVERFVEQCGQLKAAASFRPGLIPGCKRKRTGGKGRLIGSFSGAIQAMERRTESLIAGIVHNNLEGIKVHFQVRNVIGRIKFHHVFLGKIPKITL